MNPEAPSMQLAARSLILTLTAWFACSASPVAADVRVPAFFSDHMVLQRDIQVPVWGWADAGERVTVTLAGQTQSATADAAGRWRVELKPLAAGGPLELKIAGHNQLTIADVLVGEVWLASGQSNMALSVERAKDFDKEQAAAKLPQIRFFSVSATYASEPATDVPGATWKVCSPDTVGRFSATAFFFVRKLNQELNVPVGVLQSAVGGTPIESWIARESQERTSELEPFLAWHRQSLADFDPAEATARFEKAKARWKEQNVAAKKAGKPAPRAPKDPVQTHEKKANLGGLYNGMIAPLAPYAIRGAIWYQGEANAQPDKAQFYHDQLKLLVTDWRAQWGEGDFPFAWVQLPNFNRAGGFWERVREGMLQTLSLPNTGMAITIDIGDPKNIHPTNKQDVGLRLAAWALGTVYGKEIATSGPLPEGNQASGSEIIVSFSHADGGLTARGGALRGFMIAGDDREWKPATARIEGERVILSNPEIKHPVAVRYAWEPNPDVNLYNGAGLPASPFRTDDWKE
jgi:sialate O-acetylesterase